MRPDSSASFGGSRVKDADDRSQARRRTGCAAILRHSRTCSATFRSGERARCALPMTITGYSDRINHALAFAAKHHDQQVRKGTRLPYLTHPANVAVILTRYDRDEDTVVAGILHDVVEDCVRDGYSEATLQQRIAEKYGASVLETVLQVTHRKLDDDGVELSSQDRKADYL